MFVRRAGRVNGEESGRDGERESGVVTRPGRAIYARTGRRLSQVSPRLDPSLARYEALSIGFQSGAVGEKSRLSLRCPAADERPTHFCGVLARH